MPKIKIFSLLCLILYLTASLAQNQTGLELYIENSNLQPSPIAKMTKKRINLSESFGEVIAGNEEIFEIVTFSEEGDRIENTLYSPDGSILIKDEYQHDNYGNVTEKITSGAFDSEEEYKYDDSGKLVESVNTYTEGVLKGSFSVQKYKYDDSGKLVEETRYNSKGELSAYQKIRYDENGNKIEIAHYDSESALKRKYTYVYDEQNNRTEYISDAPEFGDYSKFTYTEFDALGNYTEQNFYDSNDVLLNQARCEYEYDNYSNWTKQTCIKYRETSDGWIPDYRASKAEVLINEIEYYQRY